MGVTNMTYRHPGTGRRAELRGVNIRLFDRDGLVATAAYEKPIDCQAVARGWATEVRSLADALAMRPARLLATRRDGEAR